MKLFLVLSAFLVSVSSFVLDLPFFHLDLGNLGNLGKQGQPNTVGNQGRPAQPNNFQFPAPQNNYGRPAPPRQPFGYQG
ncbi:hypothetical protein QR680_013775 [Steinernema hermaphroditum]|uniref:Uncharacterized protein n=1 Tax=Steinernema hermaphroditum TaxID=289476 RepID=A0AA39I9E8_9BILA|nr:hypothetical protein QR680_013775 [Steinernema hermaphroditum]